MHGPQGKPARYHMVDFDQLPGVACPCGVSHRAFLDLTDYPATIHRTEITPGQNPTTTSVLRKPITSCSANREHRSN